MSDRVIACANCGAKYKIPESFSAPRAKCKGCGSTIEVGGASAAASEPPPLPTARPRTATPPPPRQAPSAGASRPARTGAGSGASARSEREAGRSSTREPRAAAREERKGVPSARSARGSSGDAGARRGRRGSEEEPAKKSKMPLFAGIGVVLIAGVVALVVMMNREKPTTPAENGPAALQTPAKGAAAPDVVAKAPEPEKAPVGDATTTGSPADATASKTDTKPAEPPKKKDPAAPPAKKKVAAFNAKTELEPLPFPDDVPADKKTEYAALAEQAAGDGMPARRAQIALEKAGRHGMPALINALRELDYTNPDNVMVGFAINKTLEKMTKGANAQYRTIRADEKPDQDDIYWNNRVVDTWQRFYKTNGMTEDAWTKMLARNAEKEKAEGGDEDK